MPLIPMRRPPKTVSMSLLCLLLLWVLGPDSHGDIVIPKRTTLIFIQNGQPYDKPVSFKLVCYGKIPNLRYGWAKQKKSETLSAREMKDISLEVDAECPKMPCVIDHPFYVPILMRTTHCDLQGVMNGRPFKIRNFSSHLTEKLKCGPLVDPGHEPGKSIFSKKLEDNQMKRPAGPRLPESQFFKKQNKPAASMMKNEKKDSYQNCTMEINLP